MGGIPELVNQLLARMNLPFLQFAVAEIEGLPPEQAQGILDALWQHPKIRNWERFRIWGVNIPIVLLLSTFVLYYTTRDWLPAELMVIVQTSVLSLSLVTILTVLLTYKLMMTKTLRRLVREHIDAAG